MEISPTELRAECDRAAREFLAMDGWTCPRAKVRAIVQEMVTGAKISNVSLAWLLNQAEKLPPQAEPARRLHDLKQAVEALQAHKVSVAAIGSGDNA